MPHRAHALTGVGALISHELFVNQVVAEVCQLGTGRGSRPIVCASRQSRPAEEPGGLSSPLTTRHNTAPNTTHQRPGHANACN